MAASNGNDPPHRGPTFLLEFFDTRDFSKKAGFSQRLGWGVAKNERILEKISILDGQVFFPTKKVPFFNGKMIKMAKIGQNMACQEWPEKAKNALKMP